MTLTETDQELITDTPQNSLIGLPASDEADPVVWLQVTVNATPRQQHTVEACFTKNKAVAITLADGEDTPIFEPLPGETPLWPSLMISGLFELPKERRRLKKRRQRITQNIQRTLNTEVVCSVLEDQEWVRTCLQDFVPIDVGQDFWIVPTWLPVPESARVALKLDPGLAFGTGTHPTTFLCLAWLAEQAPNISATIRVIDYGCGSGILGIGAALLGAQQILATDIDGQALLATHMNAEKNQVLPLITTLKPQELHQQAEHTPGVDILLANILAEPLLALAPRLAQLVAPGGQICLSGLLERHQDEIIQAYRPYFDSFECKTLDGWTRVTAVRASS